MQTWARRADEEKAERAKQRLQKQRRGGLPITALPFVLCSSDIISYLGAGETLYPKLLTGTQQCGDPGLACCLAELRCMRCFDGSLWSDSAAHAP